MSYNDMNSFQSGNQPPLITSLQIPNWFPKDIGVLGFNSAGKTVLLSAALRALQTKSNYQITSTIYTKEFIEKQKKKGNDNDSDSEAWITETNQNSAYFLMEASKFLGDTGDLPLGNNSNVPFSINIAHKPTGLAQDGHFLSLGIVDSKGAYSASPREHAYWQYMQKVKGILFVIDASGAEFVGGQREGGGTMGYSELITNFSNNIQNSSESPFVAICLSKIDLRAKAETLRIESPLHAEQIQNNPTELENLISDIIGGGNWTVLKNTLGSRHKIFLSSSVGWIEDAGKFRSNFKNNKLEDSKRWHPYQVATPLVWLMDQVERRRDLSRRIWGWGHLIVSMRKTNEAILKQAHDDSNMKLGKL